MKREILFRGKRVDNGEWVYGNYIEKIDPTKEEPTFWASLIHDKALTANKVIPETVGQFTGLTDKNGTKIFEGDIISYNFRTKFSNDSFTSPVQFEEFMWITDEHSLNRLNNIEITSNIHDNTTP